MKKTQPMLCWLTKKVVARQLDHGGELPAWLGSHLGRCPRCQQDHDKQRWLIERLSASAPLIRHEAPPFLRTRILANLDRPFDAVSSARYRRASAWTIAVLAGLAAGVSLVIFNLKQHSTPDAQAAQGGPTLSPTAFAPMARLLSGETVLSLSAKLDEPLETELHLVMADARNVVNSLSRSFVPEEVLANWR